MKIPRLKIRKNTRATIAGLLIAVASLWALSMAYEEARNNLLSFFLNTLVLLLLIFLCAAAVVAILHGIKKVLNWLLNKNDADKPE